MILFFLDHCTTISIRLVSKHVPLFVVDTRLKENGLPSNILLTFRFSVGKMMLDLGSCFPNPLPWSNSVLLYFLWQRISDECWQPKLRLI